MKFIIEFSLLFPVFVPLSPIFMFILCVMDEIKWNISSFIWVYKLYTLKMAAILSFLASTSKYQFCNFYAESQNAKV